MNTSLLPRPWSCDRPRVPGYEPLISGKVERVGRRRRNSWRTTVRIDDCPVYFSHHDTKAAAESKCGCMIESYSKVHYFQV